MDNRDIAIVGISVFCPAGDSVDEVWDGISRGGDFITEAPRDVIEDFYFDGNPNGVDSFYCNRGGFCQAFKVDPIRYGVMPITASGTDPDQLISMAVAEQALIDAGVFEKQLPLQKCSVIIGKGNFSGVVALRSLEIIRMSHQIGALLKAALPNLTDGDLEKFRKTYQGKQGRYQPDMATGTMPNLVASLVANRFDMQGPAYTIDAACASGIVAINHSINLLRTGQCDMALAGGMHPVHSAMFWGAFDMLGAMSRKQVIAPFSEDADGLLIGQGGGFLVLKTLDRAIRDEDRIYAIVKETAVCSDGASSHVMVTSVGGQTRVLEQAWSKSGMDPGRIGYIEAHGTGTIVGDRTEIMTLKTFFGDNTASRAYVGSIKSNIGHAMPAAGMLGIIKTALALYWRKIPPTLHCERPLSAMFESRFLPPQELVDWDGEQLPLVAGVNAFGFGGINAHAILTAYEPESGKYNARRKYYFGEALMLSAHSGPALIEKLQKGDFSDTGGDYRIVIFDPDDKKLQQAEAVVKNDKPWHGRADIWFSNRTMLSGGGKIVFMLPGYNLEWDQETYKLSEMLDLPSIDSLISQLYDGTEISRLILQTHYTKLLCKSGLDKLGVEADMYVGHSVGEWDAVVFAGMADADLDKWKKNLENIWQVTKNYPTIAIGGVSRREAEKICEIAPDLWVASDNCPSQVLIIGKEPSVEILKKKLEDERIMYTLLPFGSGWHTPLAADEVGFHRNFIRDVRVHEGRAPVWSAHPLEKMPTEKEPYEKLQAEQFTSPIYFRELIEKLYDEQHARIFVQIGFGSLTGFVEDTLRGRDFCAISTNISARNTADQLRRVLAALFIEGRQVDAEFLGVKPGYRVSNNLLVLPRGAPPLIREMPELNDIISKRYNGASPFSGTSAGVGPGSYADLDGRVFEKPRNPVEAAVNDNMREALAAQRELAQVFGQYAGTPAPAAAPGKKAAPAPPPKKPAPSLTSAPAAKSAPDTAHAAAQKPVAVTEGDPFVPGGAFEETLALKFEDHPYLVDHSIVRQPEDWPITADLNPVVPFTMTIELLAEIAMRRAPGRKLVKIGNLVAFRWIALQEPFETTVKGRWITPETLELEVGEYAKAECTFSDVWPEPPAEYDGDGEPDIGDEIMDPCPSGLLYDKFSFHGPQYHSGIMQSGICSRGLRVTVEKREGKGSLLDIMGQQLGLFLHLTQSVNTISFPVRLKELVFYSGIFDQEGDFVHTLQITKMTDNIVVGNMVLKRGGRAWCTAKDFVCQRFENIIPVWNVILKPRMYRLTEEIAPGVHFYHNSSKDNVLFLLAKRYLSEPDREVYEGISSAKAKRENMVSRIVLKDAVRSFVAEDEREMIYPIEFYCLHDEAGKPYLKGYGDAAKKVDGLCVSLSHKDNAAIAIVSYEPVGIDLENIEEKTDDFLNMAYTSREIELIKGLDSPEAAIRFWVAKEAYAKMTGDGLKGNPKRFEVSAIDGDALIIEGARVQTVKIDDKYIAGWTVAGCRGSE
ncbi:MAG: 4'-phosphopantetheinyl transferase superfamily protein [Oscillospiraceae bacterium]|jgi:3-oxoacyl-(acyl-carrier-protein) synthase/malonyl CoA-acyl carrier protein transacylase/phosphopantetheinyl transferase (holo-ACP synthase)|nr:4'-phosphopantetheinyl transferase superfamily protein [Oscillospiraceae bacterium]